MGDESTAAAAAQELPRKTVKVRSGCIECKRSHRKCDEKKPICGRCLRTGSTCTYPVPKGGAKTRTQRSLLPAASAMLALAAKAPHSSMSSSSSSTDSAPTFMPTPKSLSSSPTPVGQLAPVKLKPVEVLYFDRFRNQVAVELGKQVDSPTEFWLRSVLRESTVDACVRNAVLAIGALAHAQDEDDPAQRQHQPLYTLSLRGGGSRTSHYRQALGYFTKALGQLRTRISEAGSAAHGDIRRSILISTVLFSVFETLQGNTLAVDRLTGQGIALLKDALLNEAAPSDSSPSVLARVVDDQGIREAESFLIRNSTWNVTYSPLYPCQRDSIRKIESNPIDLVPDNDPRHDTDEFCLHWWQVVNLIGVWRVRLEPVLADGLDKLEPSVGKQVQQDLDVLLEKVDAWKAASWERIGRAKDPEETHLLYKTWIGMRAVRLMTFLAIDRTGARWDEIGDEDRELLNFVQMAPRTGLQSQGDGGWTVMYDSPLSGMSIIAQEMRDAKIRHSAMRSWRSALTPETSWDLKSIYMGTSALVELEEGLRGEDGRIPVSSRYHWTEGRWNEEHTEFLVTMTSVLKDERGHRDQKQVTLRPEDFGFL